MTLGFEETAAAYYGYYGKEPFSSQYPICWDQATLLKDAPGGNNVQF